MKRTRLHLQALILLAACFFAVSATPSHAVDRKEVITHARESYYSLRGMGLLEFQSSIKPTWEITLADQIRSDPAGAQRGLDLLNGLHFNMTLDDRGKVKVEHRADIAPPNEQAAKGFNQIYSGMDQAVSGFFDTWSLFMLTSPFPEVESEYMLEDLGAEYRLSYKEGSTDVVTRIKKDLIITEITVTSPDFVSSIRPVLSKTGAKYVLQGYDGDYRPVSGSGTVKLNVRLDYQDVKGMQLPHRLTLDSVYDGSPTKMELVFGDYVLKVR